MLYEFRKINYCMRNKNNYVSAYLHDLKANHNVVRLENNTIRIIDQDGHFDSITLHHFKTGYIRYGLYQRDHIPFILIGIRDMNYDFVIDAFDLLTGGVGQLQSYNGDVSFTIVTFPKFEFIAERRFRFNHHFTRHLKNCLIKQLKYYNSEVEVRKRISELTEISVTSEMFETSKLYQYP